MNSNVFLDVSSGTDSLWVWTKSPSLSELRRFGIRFDRLASNIAKLQVFYFAFIQISIKMVIEFEVFFGRGFDPQSAHVSVYAAGGRNPTSSGIDALGAVVLAGCGGTASCRASGLVGAV